MKKKCLLLIALTFLLTSCSLGGPHMFSRLFDNDTEVANAHMDKILEAIQQKDEAALKAMFSKKAISEADDFDESIDGLLNFFQGDFISYNDWGALELMEQLIMDTHVNPCNHHMMLKRVHKDIALRLKISPLIQLTKTMLASIRCI